MKLPFYNKYAVFFLLAMALAGCKGPQKEATYNPAFATDSAPKKTLIFGVPGTIYYDETRKMVNYLNKHLGASAQIRCESMDGHLKQSNGRKFDIALVNGMVALDALRDGYSIAAKFDSDSSYYGVIFVNKDSAIAKVPDLKGKTLSLVARTALAGGMMPLLYLHKRGVNVNKDLKFIYAPSFESIILNVYLGKSSAGTVWVVAWRKFVEQRPEILKKVSVKWSTPSLPDIAVLFNNNLDRQTKAKLLGLLLAMHHDSTGLAALKDIGITGFKAADSTTYEPTKAFCKEYKLMIH